MPDFDEVQFPTDISYGSVGGPEFSTEVVTLSSGHERRNQNWSYPRERWNVAYGVKRREDLIALVAFFYARRGRARGFRFKNHDDFEALAQEADPIDPNSEGTSTTYQLVKRYSTGAYEFMRPITKPVAATVAIFEDTTELVSGWTLDSTTGIVTFDTEPTGTITADFEFDLPARFDSDYLPVNLETYLARSAEVTVVELRV